MEEEVMDLSFTNEHPPVNGCILIAEPFLDDTYFQRAVVLICNNDQTGAFGFVLNNYLPLKMEDLDEVYASYKGKIALGGPVDNESMYFIHQLNDSVSGGMQIKDDLYYGGNFDELNQHLKQQPSSFDKVRFFIGYSGWGTLQLEEELNLNTWKVVTDFPINELFSNYSDDLWKQLMRKQGPKYSILANAPIDPSNN